MTNKVRNTTRDYYDPTDLSVGSSSDSHKELWGYSTGTNPELESSIGDPDSFVRIMIPDLEFQVGSYSVLLNVETLENELVSTARKIIVENADSVMMAQINPYLRSFDSMGKPLVSMDLPQLGISVPEENTILIEWVFPRLRIGLFFEDNPEESSWYILSRNTDKELNAWGYLSTTGIEELTAFIFDQVFEFAYKIDG